jgi:hypothetical protein
MSLKQLVNNKSTWDAFVEYLDECISIENSKLAVAESLVDVHRAQGAVQAYQRMKYLRDKVNG